MKRRHLAVLLLVVVLLATTIGPVAAQPQPNGPSYPVHPSRAITASQLYLPLVGRDFPVPLRINLGSYPETMDPQKTSFVNEIAVLKLIYEGLTRVDSNLQTVPGAAEAWQYNSSATELTFTLRPGLQYSDGTLLNAARFAYSIKRNIDPNTRGEYAAITDEILGAPAWRGCNTTAACVAAKQTVDQSVRPLHADGQLCATNAYMDPDCNTLKLTFSRPAPYFHTIMSMWVTYPAKEELLSTGGDEWWRDPARQIGNGPFVMTTNTQDVITRFASNSRYWRGRAAYSIEYRWIADSSEAFQAYLKDELDIIVLAPADAETVKNEPVLHSQWLSFPGSCTFAFMMHNQIAPFSDHKVREAFAHALDRERWVNKVLGGLGAPTLTWIPPGFPGYDATENRWGYNPDQARQALTESSYGSAANLPPIIATYSDSPRNATRWSWLAAQFKAVLGVDIVLNPVSASQYTGGGPYQMYILGWCADYPDPQNWLSTYWKTGGFGKRIGYSNPALDALLNQADSTVNQTARMQLYAEAQRLLTTDLPVAYMWNNINNFLVKPRVKGITTTPQDSDWPGSIDPLRINLQ